MPRIVYLILFCQPLSEISKSRIKSIVNGLSSSKYSNNILWSDLKRNDWGYNQLVECLSSMCMVLDLIPSTVKEKGFPIPCDISFLKNKFLFLPVSSLSLESFLISSKLLNSKSTLPKSSEAQGITTSSWSQILDIKGFLSISFSELLWSHYSIESLNVPFSDRHFWSSVSLYLSLQLFFFCQSI